MEELRQALRAFNAERDWGQFHCAKNLATCLTVEAAELLEPFMWLTSEQSDSLDARKRGQVTEEIGDVLICLLNLCERLKIDPVEAARGKLAKNAEKYPVEKVRGKSLKHDEY